MSDTYKSSGVDINEGNRFVSNIKQMVEGTHNSSVIGGLGGFAGFFALNEFIHFKEPVLVSCTDGVGTKLKVAIDANKHTTVGIDLVAMSVNDLIVTGAKPLFFLDYIATGALSAEAMSDVVKGIVDGCKQAGAALLGGETAEMPGMYSKGDYDLAGFAVGIADKSQIIDGKNIKAGDHIICLASSGFHSNGYSLLRKQLLEKNKLKLSDNVEHNGMSGRIDDLLLTPTKIYVDTVHAVLNAGITIKGMVHITGGGFYDNIPRVLPDGVSAELDINLLPKATPVEILKKYLNDIDTKELYRVFNMGTGLIMIVDAADTNNVIDILTKCGETVRHSGKIINGNNEVKIKGIDF